LPLFNAVALPHIVFFAPFFLFFFAPFSSAVGSRFIGFKVRFLRLYFLVVAWAWFFFAFFLGVYFSFLGLVFCSGFGLVLWVRLLP
jgi:hypothetical protein